MRVEHGPNVFFVVLAAQAKQHALVRLSDEEFLKTLEAAPDIHSVCADFATYATPQRVVAIEHDDFLTVVLQVEVTPEDQGAQKMKVFRRIRNMTNFVTHSVVDRAIHLVCWVVIFCFQANHTRQWR